MNQRSLARCQGATTPRPVASLSVPVAASLDHGVSRSSSGQQIDLHAHDGRCGYADASTRAMFGAVCSRLHGTPATRVCDLVRATAIRLCVVTPPMGMLPLIVAMRACSDAARTRSLRFVMTAVGLRTFAECSLPPHWFRDPRHRGTQRWTKVAVHGHHHDRLDGSQRWETQGFKSLATLATSTDWRLQLSGAGGFFVIWQVSVFTAIDNPDSKETRAEIVSGWQACRTNEAIAELMRPLSTERFRRSPGVCFRFPVHETLSVARRSSPRKRLFCGSLRCCLHSPNRPCGPCLRLEFRCLAIHAVAERRQHPARPAPVNPRFRYVGASTVNSWDWNGTTSIAMPCGDTTSVMSNLGNITSLTQTTTSPNGAVWNKTTTNVFGQDNVSAWILGRLTSSTVVSTAPDADTQIAANPRSAGNSANATAMSSPAPSAPQPLSPTVFAAILQLLLDD